MSSAIDSFANGVKQAANAAANAAATGAGYVVAGAQWGARQVVVFGKAVANFAVSTFNKAKPFFTDTVFPAVSNGAKSTVNFASQNRNYIFAGLVGAAATFAVCSVYNRARA